jgi:hypothetical protein
MNKSEESKVAKMGVPHDVQDVTVCNRVLQPSSGDVSDATEFVVHSKYSCWSNDDNRSMDLSCSSGEEPSPYFPRRLFWL